MLSNAIHLAADTGRVITCPFIPGRIPEGTMAMVAVDEPEGISRADADLFARRDSRITGG